MLEERLKKWAQARGYKVAIAGTGVIDLVKRKLEERRSRGMFDPGFYGERLSSFRFLEGVTVPGSSRIVMVAVPSPIQILPVTIGGRKVDTLIPPTYVRYNAMFKDVLDDMTENALGPGAAEILRAPLKAIAAHMGLVFYGRNNITYVPGLGSGHQLCGYVVGSEEASSEGPATGASAEKALERCSTCRACIKICPTGAIREDRFLISAEKCFALLSESPKPIPAWARPPKSFCIIGCMDCQEICPENKGRLKTLPSGAELSAVETEALIEAGRGLGVGSGSATAADGAHQASAAWRSAMNKLDALGMSEDLRLIGRNLEYFLSI